MSSYFEATVDRMPVVVEIDDEGTIRKITMQHTNWIVELSEERMEKFLDDNEHIIAEVLRENARDAEDWEKHTKLESSRSKYI